MRSILRGVAGIGLAFTFCSLGLAPRAWAVQPTTQPAAEGKILVLPFKALNKSDYQAWLGRSIQQSLLADLTAAAPDRALSADSEPADTNAALDLGRKDGAQYVVDGSFATAGQELRLTGTLLDVNTGKPVAGLKATGPISAVFHLEDQIAGEVRQKLSLGPVAPLRNGEANPYATTEPPMQPLRSTSPSAPSDEYYSSVAPRTYTAQPNEYYYNNYYYETSPPAYDYGYGYGYGWGYPWWYPTFGFVAISDGRFHHHDHDHDFDDDHFHGGHDGFHHGSTGLRPPIGAGAGSAIITPSRPGGHFGSSTGFGARVGAGAHFGGAPRMGTGQAFGGGGHSFGGAGQAFGGAGHAGGGHR